MPSNIRFAFFGTSRFSVIVLDELQKAGLVPQIIVTPEDKPQGRKLVLTPPPTKIWAEKNKINVIQPRSLDNEFATKLEGYDLEISIVASYGKIIPENVLNIPNYRTLNIHPSLLPKLRGASPIQSAILWENETGVTIIRLDEQMDHGPIIAQEKLEINEWPPYAEELEEMLAKKGAKMTIDLLPKWINGEIEEIAQEEGLATFSKKIEKTDGEINLNGNPDTNLRKIRAYQTWPRAYFFINGKRVIVNRAHIENEELVIDRVIPEGKNEMDYKDFLKNNSN